MTDGSATDQPQCTTRTGTATEPAPSTYPRVTLE